MGASPQKDCKLMEFGKALRLLAAAALSMSVLSLFALPAAAGGTRIHEFGARNRPESNAAFATLALPF